MIIFLILSFAKVLAYGYLGTVFYFLQCGYQTQKCLCSHNTNEHMHFLMSILLSLY